MSSPWRTTQIVTGFRSVSSLRSDAIRSSSADSIRSSSSLVQVVIGNLLRVQVVVVTRSAGREGLTPPGCRLEGRIDPATGGGVDFRPGGDDLVDAVEHVVRELDARGRKLGFEMVHRARPDD